MLLLLVTLSLSLLAVMSAPSLKSLDDVTQIGVYNMSLQADTLFELFKDNYARTYEGTLEEKRRQIFADNVRYIKNHNVKYANGESTYYLGINKFTDMTYEEFVTDFVTCVNEDDLSIGNASFFLPPENYQGPSSVDWREKGYVTLVKDQGACGSCWAFSATGSIEGQHFRKTCQLVSLSEQQLLDCSKEKGNKGCKGGNVATAFEYVVQQGGIEGEKDYSYQAMAADKCSFSKDKIKATIQSYNYVPPGETNLETTTASVGPVSAAIYVSEKFQKYKRGVFDDPDCSKKAIGKHAVLVVGYGSDYWLVKNSWGTDWGDNGYIKIAKNRNMCDIASNAVVPVVESGSCTGKGPKNQSLDVFLWLFLLLIC